MSETNVTPNSSNLPRAVSFVSDLFFTSKLMETAKQLGVGYRNARTLDKLSKELEQGCGVFICDLNSDLDSFSAIALCKKHYPATPCVAFFSHVDVELEEKALAVGCDEVLPRSKFVAHLVDIIARARAV